MKRIMAAVAWLLSLGVSGAMADPVQVVTEPYPGYSFLENGKVVGAGADQVHLLFERAKIDYTMDIMPWARAYRLATHEENTCVFAANHTPERDALFKWVEPLGGGRVVLVRRAGSPVAPKTLEEAKAFTVGVQRGDYAADYLQRQGFTKLDYAADFGLTLKKLVSGRIDLAMTSDAAFRAETAKGQPLQEVLSMPAAIYALACSLDVPTASIRALQAELDAMILSGEQDKIYLRHGMPAQNLQSFVQKTD